MLIQNAGVFLFGMPGPMEWLLIAAGVAVLFGASRLPKLGKGLGEGISNFKKGLKGEKPKEDKEKLLSNDQPESKDKNLNS